MKKMINFYLPTKIIFSKGAINSLPGALRSEESRVLLVTGRKSARNAQLSEQAIKILKGRDVVLFDKVFPEPDTEVIDEGIALAKINKCDVVIGIGGGSVLDVSKAIAAMLRENKFTGVADYLEVDGTKTLEAPGVPFIAVPTTSGTGSEVTKNSVIINRKLKNKRS